MACVKMILRIVVVALLLISSSPACISQVLQLTTLDVPKYPWLSLSARIQFDLNFGAVLRPDGTLTNVELLSARGLNDTAQRWVDARTVRKNEFPKIVAALNKWRIDAPRDSTEDRTDNPMKITICFRYRVLQPDYSTVDEKLHGTRLYEIEQGPQNITMTVRGVSPFIVD